MNSTGNLQALLFPTTSIANFGWWLAMEPALLVSGISTMGQPPTNDR